MFSKIIVATDLSNASFAVVNCLGGLISYGASECLLLQCLGWPEASSLSLSYTTIAKYLESTLSEQKEILEKQGFKVTTRVVPGSAKREINRIADEEDYSLIVVGSTGHSIIGEAFLGGVAYSVIHNARKPVLLIRLEIKRDKKKEYMEATRCDFSKHVLFPTDFSENADHAFTYLQKLVSAGANQVTLMHVQDKGRIEPHLVNRLDEFNNIDRERLEKMKQMLEEKGRANISIELCYGSPSREIIRFINENNINLVVMGSQGRSFVEELFLGSVSHNVARHSVASVLLVPARQKAYKQVNIQKNKD